MKIVKLFDFAFITVPDDAQNQTGTSAWFNEDPFQYHMIRDMKPSLTLQYIPSFFKTSVCFVG